MTKDRLLRGAIRLFARRGIDGVSVADLAQAAGVSKANVLHHFKSKDGLYAAALDRIDEELARRTERAAARPDPEAALAEELTEWTALAPEQVRLTAYALLRLSEHPGRWRLAETVDAMIDLQPGLRPSDRLDSLVGLLGRLTYGVMIAPLIEELKPESDAPREPTRALLQPS